MGAPGEVAASIAEQLPPDLASVSVGAGHPAFDAARRVWNGCHDLQPAVIIRCRTTSQVVEAVRFARESGLTLSVRGGGHSLPGFSTNDGGIVLDLSEMRAVTVNPGERVATAQGGCTWGDYDQATQAHGLASTGGMISTTGIGGLTLGGGVGWLTRKYGLACDNLLAAEVVSADGTVVRASADEEPDLLWSLRGGGGNFGVVTSFEFRVHPVGPQVHGGFFLFPISRLAELARAYRELVADLPDELTTLLSVTNAPDDDAFPPDVRGLPSVIIGGCDLGGEAEALRRAAVFRDLRPSADFYGPMTYLELQKAFDADYPAGDRYYFRGGVIGDLTDEAIEIIQTHVESRPSGRNGLDWHHMGGAFARVGVDATAFPERRLPYLYNVLASWSDPADDDANRDWARAFAADLERLGGSASYVNFLSEQAGSGTYGAGKQDRLTQVKQRYDPGNLFRLNQNVRP